jgi:acyl-CoA synthetase (AMP-forming)/AMP-acid ligase II
MTKTLSDLLCSAAQERPDRVAFWFLRDGGDDVLSITYGELHEQACGVARVLGERAPGERVLLLYPPGLEFLGAMFGALYAASSVAPAGSRPSPQTRTPASC